MEKVRKIFLIVMAMFCGACVFYPDDIAPVAPDMPLSADGTLAKSDSLPPDSGVEPGYAYRNLQYAEAGGVKLFLDIYTPVAKPPFPIIVYIHAGGWMIGTKSDCDLKMVDQGYAVACVDYRLSDVAKFPAQIHDIKASIRWLRANAQKYRLNYMKFGVMGHSAGGHLAALLGASAGVIQLEGDLGNLEHSSRVQAVVDFYGPADFFSAPVVYTDTQLYRDYTFYLERALGSPVAENPVLAKLMSPTTHINKYNPPFFIVHGEQDDIIPYQQSQLLYDKLLEAGVPAIFRLVPNMGHAFKFEEVKDLFVFFDKYLK